MIQLGTWIIRDTASARAAIATDAFTTWSDPVASNRQLNRLNRSNRLQPVQTTERLESAQPCKV